MAYLTALVFLLGLLCVLNLVLTFGIVRRLRREGGGSGVGAEASTGAGARKYTGESHITEGAIVAPFIATDVHATPVSLRDLRPGHLVAFVSPACPTCADSLPSLVAVARERGAEQVLAVVVTSGRGPDTDPAPYVSALTGAARVVVTRSGDELPRAFAVTGFPAYVVMGEGGRVATADIVLSRVRGQVGVGA